MSDHMQASTVIGEKLLHWSNTVAAHDYDAAISYLSIANGEARAQHAAIALRDAPVTERRANDILRATGRPPLPMDDPGVLGALKHVLSGHELSPVLVAKGDIADGYHRVSLAYNLDPFDTVPLKLA